MLKVLHNFVYHVPPSLPSFLSTSPKKKKKTEKNWQVKTKRQKMELCYISQGHQKGLEIIYILNYTTWGHSALQREAGLGRC